MRSELNQIERIELYLLDEMSLEEKQAFQDEINQSEDLKKEVDIQLPFFLQKNTI